MTKQALSNHTFVVAIACALGFTACPMGAGEKYLEITEEDSPEKYDDLSQALVVNDMLPTLGTKTISIASYPDAETIVYMDSPSDGNWEFKANGSLIGWDGCYTGEHAVFTFWRDYSDPYGDWNEWPGGGGLCYPTSFWTTNLYSGSSNISYKFVIENYLSFPSTPYGQGVRLHFTKRN